MTQINIAKKFGAGVSLEQDVLEYLRLLCEENQRDRSFIINAIVREHAKQRQNSQKPEPIIHL